jgi:HAD superfamily hydrolase (TIGR01509 family)
VPHADLDVDVIIFDLFGVIIGFDNDIVYSRLARHCADPDNAITKLNGLMAGHEVITGALTLPQIHRRLADDHGLALGFADFEAAWLEPYSWPIAGMAELVERLARHYRLILLSNVDGYYWSVVRDAHPELAHFTSLLLSCDLGLAKPDPAIFRHASEVAAAPPSRCVFVDDTLANVEAARELGFHGHHFRGYSDFVAAMHAGGVKGARS